MGPRGHYAGMDAATGTTLAIGKTRLSIDFETATRITALLDG